ncbi:bifunctional 2-polyprenyl-6-hydroxyphenol methylase/3-demethylubiquinol 3-O-methyltransferase UbiG [Pelagibacteraceae bacterium]|nr:bifunctional 2-polyprenyl-6-hydroxyphenol methylase/3-demethylubiquinol 3-O-methyltransferase UbiG [Pelagibacteraceae bacterium]
MMKYVSKNDEYELFDKLSNDWWNENGKFRVLHQIRSLRISYILEQIKKRKLNGLDILDVGCGGGLVCEPLARLGANLTGIDFVKNNISIAAKHAKKNNLKINYICKDIEKLNIKKKYDVILLLEVLEHLNDWRQSLQNIISNLNKEGILIISTINRNLISKLAAIYIAENLLNWIPEGTHNYNKLIKPEEIKNELKYNKLKIQGLKGMYFNPILNSWRFTNFIKVNYFLTGVKN